jgi:3-methyladenine DNA glycosylase/8-oxoguanine DNA glycosylase
VSALLDLPFQPPYHAGAALRHLALHSIPGADYPTAHGFTRLIETVSGPTLAAVEFDGSAVQARLEGGDTDEAAAVIRQWLDLDADPARVDGHLAADPVLAPLVQAQPGVRVIGHPSGFEAAVTTVIGQQISLAAARTCGGRLVAAYGEPGPGGLLRFPAPDRLTEAADMHRVIGVPGARGRTIRAVAELFAGGFALSTGAGYQEARAALLALPGIGPWTVDYLSVKVLGNRDAFPASDLVVRKKLGVAAPAAAAQLAEAWRPLRAYAAFRLWAHANAGG